jgi:hypothetical protein
MLRLVADPPVQDNPEVWVHLPSGDPIGHLPPEIAQWLWPWMLQGGVAEARALRVRGTEVPSWRPTLREACRQKVDTPNSVRSVTSSASSTRNGSPYGTRINDP